MNDLYELTNQYKLFSASLEEMLENGEIDEQALEDSLAYLECSIEDICFDLCKLLKNKEGYALSLNNRINEIEERVKQLKAKKSKCEEFIDYIKQKIETALASTKKEKIENADFNISMVGKKQSVEVIDIDKVPSKFFKEKKTYTLDKIKAYESLKDGENISGLKLGKNKKIRIK